MPAGRAFIRPRGFPPRGKSRFWGRKQPWPVPSTALLPCPHRARTPPGRKVKRQEAESPAGRKATACTGRRTERTETTHHGALANASHCDGGCGALRWRMRRTAWDRAVRSDGGCGAMRWGDERFWPLPLLRKRPEYKACGTGGDPTLRPRLQSGGNARETLSGLGGTAPCVPGHSTQACPLRGRRQASSR